MIADYYKFVQSIGIADHNVLVIFIIALGGVLAFYSIRFLPRPAQHTMRVVAWIYAVLVLVLTVIYSKGG